MKLPVRFDPPTDDNGDVPLNPAALNRRAFLTKTVKGSVLAALAAPGLVSLAGAVETPLPSEFLYFETGDRQWIFVTGAFTWSGAMKLPLSTAITNRFGKGWLLAPMLSPEDFVNAARVTKLAQGDLRNRRGPFLGVYQVPGSSETTDGWANLDGSVPFITWARTEPNDGRPLHRNILREQKFREALRAGAQILADYALGSGSAEKAGKIIDFVISEISRTEDGEDHDDVVALFHERDGSIAAADVSFKSFYSALLSRKKPVRPPANGPLPSWPRVNGMLDLTDGMNVPRRSVFSWRWTGGARLGQVHVVNLRTGRTVINRLQAATPRQRLEILRPGEYLFRVRNYSRFTDPWLEIGFNIV